MRRKLCVAIGLQGTEELQARLQFGQPRGRIERQQPADQTVVMAFGKDVGTGMHGAIVVLAARSLHGCGTRTSGDTRLAVSIESPCL